MTKTAKTKTLAATSTPVRTAPAPVLVAIAAEHLGLALDAGDLKALSTAQIRAALEAAFAAGAGFGAAAAFNGLK